MSVKLSDVAREAGGAQYAVSVILRNTPVASQYSETTRKRILKTANELGYRPNFFASQLHAHNRRVLMLCINYLQDPVSSRIAHGFEYRIAQQNYKLLISVVREKPKEDSNNLDILGMHGITGIAVIGSSIKKLTNKFKGGSGLAPPPPESAKARPVVTMSDVSLGNRSGSNSLF